MKKTGAVAKAFLLTAAFQGARMLLEWYPDSHFGDDSFVRRMITAVVMLVLSGVVILFAHFRKVPLSFFPIRFGKAYVIASCVFAALLISTPSNYTEGWRAVLLLIYGSIVTPVFEELIFRGYLWNRMNQVLKKETITFVWSVVLFCFWHFGYIIPQLLSRNLIAVFGKLAAGLGYGVVLGLIRLKTKNCYSTVLAHGILNIFMI